VNQLLILEPSIIKRKTLLEKKYEIKDLQVTIDGYKFISKFNVTPMFDKDIDIILGSTWLETLGTFILNMKKKFLTFSYRKKKITLQDITMRSCSVAPSSEDLKDVSK
jgi:hypothetical protein